MQTSPKGIQFIAQFEGCHLNAYPDPTGTWTIGYGHTAGVTPTMSITMQQALLYLAQDLANKEKYVNKYTNIYHFTQDQFDALVSFTYNCGQGNLNKLLSNGNKPLELVKLDLPNTCTKSKGKELKGLVRRRKAEAELMGDCHKDIHDVAYEVMANMWGTGTDRKRKLTDAGYNYREVQDVVNAYINAKTSGSKNTK